eukprot:GSChrysophyteH1.ASY1.ANO1.1044.1 assembled CDS
MPRDMIKEGLQVMVRVRPPISSEVKLQNVVSESGGVSVSVSSDKTQVQCSYDRVFGPTCEQIDIFESVRPLLNDVLKGVNGTIFAYGQTSAGKSHTMIGPDGGADIPRTPKSKWAAGELTFNVKASFLQIYNEMVYDLLRDSATNAHETSGLKIREISRPTVYVSGLSEFRVTTTSDVLALVAAGTSNRAMRSTDFNATSSRSHAVLQLRCKLSLADLAGSEKILTNIEVPRHLRELTSINTSLSCLGNVIAALTDKHRTHVPYRDSKLTRLLQDSLGGNTRTILVACIAPTEQHTSESVSTLQFADRAKGVMTKVGAEDYLNGDTTSVDFYIKENARLREELFELRTMFGQSDASEGNQKKILKQSEKKARSWNDRPEQSDVGTTAHNSNPDSERTRGSALHRVNNKQRRRRNRKGNHNVQNGDERDSSRLVSRFRQASQHDSHALSSSGASKIYGSSSSLKTLRKARANVEGTPDDALGETNREYFNGFLSALDLQAQGAGEKGNSAPQKTEKVNPYIMGKGKSSSKTAQHYRGDNGGTSQSLAKVSSTSPSRMRIEAERVELEHAYRSVQDELNAERGVLDNLTAQRMSLERQLYEVGISNSPDSADNTSSHSSVEAEVEMLTTVTSVRRSAPPAEPHGSEDKENHGGPAALAQPRGGITSILSPASKPKGGAHAAHLRENVHQASLSQALPSPTKSTASDLSQAPESATPMIAEERQISKEGLYYSQDDVGRDIQQFSFRTNDWFDLKIDGFDECTGRHDVISVDGKSTSINLHNKPIRVLLK